MFRQLLLIGIMLIIAGIALVIASTLKPIIISTTPTHLNKSQVEVGGCIVIFFIPICFTGKGLMMPWFAVGFTVLLIAILALIAYLIYRIARYL